MHYHNLSTEYIDTHLSVLSQKHCRFVLYYFDESSDTVASIDDLAADIRRRDDSDGGSITRSLHHATLPTLADVGAIEYDARNGTIRYRGHPALEKWLAPIAEDERAASHRAVDPTLTRSEDTDDSDAVQTTYKPEQDRTLTDAVLDAIEEYKGEELTYTDFTLFNDIDPNALNSIFKENAEPGTTLSFSTDNVRVELWGDGGVKIRISQ